MIFVYKFNAINVLCLKFRIAFAVCFIFKFFIVYFAKFQKPFPIFLMSTWPAWKYSNSLNFKRSYLAAAANRVHYDHWWQPKHNMSCFCFKKLLRQNSLSVSDLNRCQYIPHEIGFIEEMRTTWGDKEVPHTLFHYSFICENTFNPFNSVIGNPAVPTFKHNIRKGWLCKNSCRISNIALLILQEILRCHSFLMSQNFRKRLVANGTESTRLNIFLRIG